MPRKCPDIDTVSPRRCGAAFHSTVWSRQFAWMFRFGGPRLFSFVHDHGRPPTRSRKLCVAQQDVTRLSLDDFSGSGRPLPEVAQRLVLNADTLLRLSLSPDGLDGRRGLAEMVWQGQLRCVGEKLTREIAPTPSVKL